MFYDPDIHHRRSIRLKEYDYSQDGHYFVTICVQNHVEYFGVVENGEMILNQFGKIVEKCWNELPDHYGNCELDEYVIMPNHFHGILIINGCSNVGAIHELPLHGKNCRRKMLIPLIVGQFKMRSSKLINQIRGTPGKQLWQRNYYERVIRDEKELFNTKRYIRNNPLEWYLDQKIVNNLW